MFISEANSWWELGAFSCCLLYCEASVSLGAAAIAVASSIREPLGRVVEIYPFVYITISSIFSAPSKTTSHSPSWL